MKENIKIEELFKEKFENFQPDVNPTAWANIQAGMAASTTVATGVSAAVKIALISGGIAAASIATWYFGFYEPGQPANNPVVVEDTKDDLTTQDVTTGQTIIHVNDQNDPVIIDNKEKIEKELRNNNPATQETVNPGTVSTANNGATVTTNGSQNTSTTTTGQGNNSAETPATLTENKTTTNGSTSEQPDKTKPAPAGRMEYSQNNAYAPSLIVFTANAINYNDVKWDFGDGSSAEGAEVKHSYTRPGKYIVTVRVIGEDHTYSESQEIVVKTKSGIDNIPNVITPNDDRINDLFSIKTTDIETFVISIRDRNGNEVFNSNDKDFSWDGTDLGGEKVAKGLYSYIIIAEGTDGSIFKIPGQVYVE